MNGNSVIKQLLLLIHHHYIWEWKFGARIFEATILRVTTPHCHGNEQKSEGKQI